MSRLYKLKDEHLHQRLHDIGLSRNKTPQIWAYSPNHRNSKINELVIYHIYISKNSSIGWNTIPKDMSEI